MAKQVMETAPMAAAVNQAEPMLPFSKALQTSSPSNSQKAIFIATHLAKLALHFYRPDLAADHAKLILEDFVADLSEYAAEDIVAGIAAYRRDPKSNKFPSPGQLRAKVALAWAKRQAESQSAAESPGGVASTIDREAAFRKANRPIGWYMLERWKREWHESDVPEIYRGLINPKHHVDDDFYAHLKPGTAERASPISPEDLR
jgi:hypothetical protein